MTIFGPAIAGAGVQFGAVVLTTALLYFLSRARFFLLEWPLVLCDGDGDAACRVAATLLRLSYLMTAAGVALTDNRLIERTTMWLRGASRTLRPNGPRLLAEAVAVQLSIATIACVVEELETPSQLS